MALSASDAHSLIVWGHRAASSEWASWKTITREEAILRFSLAYYTAEEADRTSVVLEFHEGYRQHENVNELDMVALLLSEEEVERRLPELT